MFLIRYRSSWKHAKQRAADGFGGNGNTRNMTSIMVVPQPSDGVVVIGNVVKSGLFHRLSSDDRYGYVYLIPHTLQQKKTTEK